MHLREGEIGLAVRYAVVAAELQDVCTRDAMQLVLGGGRPHLATTDAEEVDRVASRHKAMGVQHQRLVSARHLGLGYEMMI